MGICPPLFQFPPAEIFQHCSDTGPSVGNTGGPSYSLALCFLYLEYLFLSVGILYWGRMLELGTYQSVIGSLSRNGKFCFYVSFEHAQGMVGISGAFVYVGILRQAKRDINIQVFSTSRTCQCK